MRRPFDLRLLRANAEPNFGRTNESTVVVVANGEMVGCGCCRHLAGVSLGGEVFDEVGVRVLRRVVPIDLQHDIADPDLARERRLGLDLDDEDDGID